MKYLKQEMEDSVFKQATLLNGQTSIACLKFLFFPQLPWYRIGFCACFTQYVLRTNVFLSSAPATPFPNITHINSHVPNSLYSKCHSLGRTLHRCQRFRGPRINITSFLSIRAYLFAPSNPKLLYICE